MLPLLRGAAAAGRGVASPASALPRAFRLLDAANRRGMALGGMAALFFIVEMLSGVYRGRRAFMQDAAVGGAAVGLVFAGACLPGWAAPPCPQPGQLGRLGASAARRLQLQLDCS